MELLLVAVIIVAILFDFTNGFHDTANSIATSVSTKAMTPRVAVLFAAVLNFAGAWVSIKVAATVAKGIVDTELWTTEGGLSIVMAGLTGAITWNLITWFFGLPSSSSHALIGGIAGASIFAAGFDVVKWGGLKEKVLIPSLVAPFLGVAFGFGIILGITWIIARRSPSRVNLVFRRLQIVSGGFVAFTHGTNDAQKTMGIMMLALVATGHADADFTKIPFWVILSAALAMGLGTYAGGWRIIKTLGQRVAKLDPPQGLAAQTSCAAILWGTAHWGFPVSTTHTISGSVLGAGAIRGFSAVRWGVAGNIVLAWLFTIPAAALVGGCMQLITRIGAAGDVLVFLIVCTILMIAALARRWELRKIVRATTVAAHEQRESQFSLSAT